MKLEGNRVFLTPVFFFTPGCHPNKTSCCTFQAGSRHSFSPGERAFLGGASSSPRGGWLLLLMVLSVVGNLCWVLRTSIKQGREKPIVLNLSFSFQLSPSCLPQTPGIGAKICILVPLSKTSSSARENSDTTLSIFLPLKNLHQIFSTQRLKHFSR